MKNYLCSIYKDGLYRVNILIETDLEMFNLIKSKSSDFVKSRIHLMDEEEIKNLIKNGYDIINGFNYETNQIELKKENLEIFLNLIFTN